MSIFICNINVEVGLIKTLKLSVVITSDSVVIGGLTFSTLEVRLQIDNATPPAQLIITMIIK